MSWFFTVNSISAPLWIALILVAVLLGLNLLVDFGVLVGLNLRKPKAAASAPKSMLPGELTKDLAPRDREFLPAALELLETPPSPIRIAGLWLICAAFAATLVWAYFGKLDIHAVAQGRIQPSGRSKTVQPLEPGKVAEILVENGSRVVAGDVLLELDPTETGADREAQTRDLESARGEIARRLVAIAVARAGKKSFDVKPIAFDDLVSKEVRRREENVLSAELGQLKSAVASLEAQFAEHQATREKLRGSIKARERSIALAKERVDMRSGLNDRGSLSRAMVIDVEAQYETLVTTQVSEQGQLVETEAQLKTTERKMDEAATQFTSDQAGKLVDIERKADKLAQDLVKATAKHERTTLRAPIAGTVQQLMVTTVGQVVGSGQSLMTIVPTDGAIEIEAMVQNSDIGFVLEGQDAVIKVDAFPFTRFGTINGKIIKVSRDAVDEREANADPATAGRGGGGGGGSGGGGSGQGKTQSFVFPATVQLEKSAVMAEGKEVPLSAGMMVTVEILTGQRRAIDYVLSPLRDIASTSARER